MAAQAGNTSSTLTSLCRQKLRLVFRAATFLKFIPALSKQQRLQTKIINKTDKTIVLRSKYRDIWEGERMQLGRDTSRMVAWTPELYKRLGAVAETDNGQASGLPLYISSVTLDENEEIAITGFSSTDALQLKKRSRKKASTSA